MEHRTYGDGTVYYDQQRSVWTAVYELPRDPSGKRRRQRFEGASARDVSAMLDAWLADRPHLRRGSTVEGDRPARMEVARSLATHTIDEWNAKVASYNRLCHYCGRPWGWALAKDHMTPISRGGSDAITNVVPTCESCNQAKHTKTAEEFVAWAAETGFFRKERPVSRRAIAARTSLARARRTRVARG